jgi:5-methylcytosine-specific restriction endonuclease McrA
MNHRVFPPYKSKVPKAKSIKGLDLKDLLKIRRSYAAYLLKQQAYEIEWAAIGEYNRDSFQKNFEIAEAEAIWDRTHLTPLHELQQRIDDALATCKVGMIGGLVFDYVEYKGQRYRRSQAEGLIKRAVKEAAAIKEVLANKPKFSSPPKKPWPKMPTGETNLTIGGAKIKFSFREIDREELDQLINQAESRKKETELKVDELHARLASSENEVRKQAQKFRRDLHKQLQVISVCPYCSGDVKDGNAHLDHIYPVSKGGKSIAKNLVFVCAQCNQDKSNLTLRTFLLQYSKDEQAVYSRLELLKKDF